MDDHKTARMERALWWAERYRTPELTGFWLRRAIRLGMEVVADQDGEAERHYSAVANRAVRAERSRP